MGLMLRARDFYNKFYIYIYLAQDELIYTELERTVTNSRYRSSFRVCTSSLLSFSLLHSRVLAASASDRRAGQCKYIRDVDPKPLHLQKCFAVKMGFCFVIAWG
jgi:hypothetical protein